MEKKICKVCNEEKNISEYIKTYNKKCKICCKLSKKKWREDNKEYLRKKDREYRESNKDKLKLYRKSYIRKKKDRKEYHKTYYQENKEYILSSKLGKKEKIIEYSKKFFLKNKNYYAEYSKNRYKNDPLFRLTKNYRSITKSIFVLKKYKKTKKSEELLGCSFEELKIHLESKFISWMNWENKGLYNGELNYGWDVDHIIPLSSATNEDEIIKLCHYTNLQPLCSKVNRDIKKNKY